MIRATPQSEVDVITQLYHQVWHEAEAGFVKRRVYAGQGY
jgi:hypothetical protein